LNTIFIIQFIIKDDFLQQLPGCGFHLEKRNLRAAEWRVRTKAIKRWANAAVERNE